MLITKLQKGINTAGLTHKLPNPFIVKLTFRTEEPAQIVNDHSKLTLQS